MRYECYDVKVQTTDDLQHRVVDGFCVGTHHMWFCRIYYLIIIYYYNNLTWTVCVCTRLLLLLLIEFNRNGYNIIIV